MRTHLAPFLLLAAACSSSAGKPPAVASSSGQSDYALHYSDEIAGATKAINDAQTKRKTLTSGFNAYVDQLKKPDWQKVDTIVDDSDAAGKSADFADAEGDAVAIRSFWDAEKNDISGRVNGAAQQKLKESGCSSDVGGVIGYSIGEAINKQLQKRLRARNDAFVVIERNKIALGPQNVSTLEKLADDVAEASYDVHVLMVNQRNRLDRLNADRNDVRKTLDRYIQEETELQAEPGRTDADKKASADRVNAAKKTKADIDAGGQQADALSKDMEKQIDAATKEYDDALKALKAKIAEKKKAEPTKS